MYKILEKNSLTRQQTSVMIEGNWPADYLRNRLMGTIGLNILVISYYSHTFKTVRLSDTEIEYLEDGTEVPALEVVEYLFRENVPL